MEPKKMIGAWLGGFVAMFLLGYVWHEMIISGYNAMQYADVMRSMEEFSIIHILIGYLILTFMMSYIYPLGNKGGPFLKEGLRFGIILGLLYTLPRAFIYAGVYEMPLGANLLDAAYHIVEMAVGGIVMAKIYDGGSASSEGTDASE